MEKKLNLLTYQQAADYLQMPLPTLYSLVCRRKIPCIKLTGRMVRFDPVRLQEWLDSMRIEPQKAEGE